MSKNRQIKDLEDITLFAVDLHGKKENRDTRFFRYDVLTSDSSSAIDLATGMAKRAGYTEVGLVIAPRIIFQCRVYADSKYLQQRTKRHSNF